MSAEMAERIDVHVVTNHLDVGGTERHISQVLPHLDPTRFRVTVQTLLPRGILNATLESAGITVTSPGERLPRWGQRGAAAARLLGRLLRRRPDVLHFFLPESYLIGGCIGVAARQPLMVMSRRSLNNYQARHPAAARIEAWLHRRMAALVGNSRAVIRQLTEECDAPDRVRLIYNGIDVGNAPDAGARGRARRELAIPDATVVFVIVANLIPYKGHEDLLRAFAAVRHRLTRPWRLYCVGRPGSSGDTLAALGVDLGLADNLHWVGERFPATPYLHAADVGVLASHEEGFSNSILEGMAAALPMIVTDVGGNPEAAVDGETGLVVPPRDPEAMGAAILRLAEDPELRARLGQAGRRRVETEFSLERCAAEYEKLYTDLAAARGAR